MFLLNHFTKTTFFLLTLAVISNSQLLDWSGNCDVNTPKKSTLCNDESGNREINLGLISKKLEKLGEIPVGKTNLKIKFETNNNKNNNIDIHLLDEKFAIIQWNKIHISNTFSFPSINDEFEYKDMIIRYNSIEHSVEIIGMVTTKLLLNVFVNEDLNLNVKYEWGIGTGKSCRHDGDCKEGLFCKGSNSKHCHVADWCYSQDSVIQDCDISKSHVEPIGDWMCQSHQCQKKITHRNLFNVTNTTNGCTERAGYEIMSLSDISTISIGSNVSVTSTVKNSHAMCTYMRCYPADACCNTCHSGIFFEYTNNNKKKKRKKQKQGNKQMYLVPQDEAAPIGCVGNECDYMNNCVYNDGDVITVYGEIGLNGDSILVHDHCKSNNIFT